MGEENGTIQAVAVKFHHLQAVARCAGSEAERFSVPGVHLQVMQDRVVFEATDGNKAGFEAVIPLPKWTAIRPHAPTTLPCSSTLYLSFPEPGANQTPKVRMKCGLDVDGPVLTLSCERMDGSKVSDSAGVQVDTPSVKEFLSAGMQKLANDKSVIATSFYISSHRPCLPDEVPCAVRPYSNQKR